MRGRQDRLVAPLGSMSVEALVSAHLVTISSIPTWIGPSFGVVQGKSAVCCHPAIDPGVLFRLQFVMFCEWLRSERQFMRLAAARLSYDWEEPVPYHSSLSR